MHINIKSFLSVAAAFALTASFADPNSPQAAIVSVTQSQSMREVTATYTLDEPAIITFDVKTNGVSIGKENLGEACVSRRSADGTGRSAYDLLGGGKGLQGEAVCGRFCDV